MTRRSLDPSYTSAPAGESDPMSEPPFTCRLCGLPVSSRKYQLCGRHYYRLRKYGDPEHDVQSRQTVHENSLAKRSKPSAEAICDYWEDYQARHTGMLPGLPAGHAVRLWEGNCWSCLIESDLEKCHIVPDSRGGTLEPSNFVILCSRCHRRDAPDLGDAALMFQWINYAVSCEQAWRREIEDLVSVLLSADEKAAICALGPIGAIAAIKQATEEINPIVPWGSKHLTTATWAGIIQHAARSLMA